MIETHCSFVLDYMHIAYWSYIHLQQLLPIFPMILGIRGNFHLHNTVYLWQLFVFQLHIFCENNRKLAFEFAKKHLLKPKQCPMSG